MYFKDFFFFLVFFTYFLAMQWYFFPTLLFNTNFRRKQLQLVYLLLYVGLKKHLIYKKTYKFNINLLKFSYKNVF
jgi:hypothetical protein